MFIHKSRCVLVVSITFAVQEEDSFQSLSPCNIFDKAATTKSLILVFEQVEFFNVTESLEEICYLLLIQGTVHVGTVELRLFRLLQVDNSKSF